MDFFLQSVQMAENIIHRFNHRVLPEEVVTLLQIADACILGHKKFPFVNAKFSCEHVQKGCFACAVSPHYAHSVAGIQVKTGLIYNYVSAVNF